MYSRLLSRRCSFGLAFAAGFFSFFSMVVVFVVLALIRCLSFFMAPTALLASSRIFSWSFWG
jgi:hypothetical protein